MTERQSESHVERAHRYWRQACGVGEFAPPDPDGQMMALKFAMSAILDHLEATERSQRKPVIRFSIDPLAERLGAVVKDGPPPIAPDRPESWLPPTYTPLRDLIMLAYAAFSRPQMTPTVDGFVRWLDAPPELAHLIETTLENQ